MLSDVSLPFLPEEIVTDIFKRLPVKSLIRFQCVSKQWKNLIKAPSFVQEHLHHHTTHQNPSLLIEHFRRNNLLNLCLLDREMQFRELENLPSIGSLMGVHVVGSCHGLICLTDYSINPPAPLLWNPATRDVRRMPVTLADFPVFGHFGFGFSPPKNDYKIVRFYGTNMIYKVEVYSLSTGSWKDLHFDNIKDLSIFGDGVTIKGVMFWYGSRRGAVIKGSDVIISLDLATEVFTVTPSPASLSHVGVKLAVCEEKLVIISRLQMVNSQGACIYFGVMEEGVRGSFEGRWSLRRIYGYDCDPFQLYVGTIWMNRIVCFAYGMNRLIGETEVKMENAEPKCGLYIINISTNERNWFAIPGPRHGYCASVCNYVESLVQIGDIQH
ncbi:hypothetical protein QN277_005758 [Acacia crassicarpa]|nr:hypothetical protein QN277_005758 [Acacia crassicarpa]